MIEMFKSQCRACAEEHKELMGGRLCEFTIRQHGKEGITTLPSACPFGCNKNPKWEAIQTGIADR
jgi:hypothetical protein